MEYLSAIDFFGSHLHWYVNHKKKLYTRLWGILSIISISICVSLFIILLKELIDRKNPQITEDDYPHKEYKKIKFGDEKIYIPWTIGDYHSHDANFTGWIYPIVYYYYGERDKELNRLPYYYKILNYTLCNNTNLKSLTYFEDSSVDFDKLYCIDMEDIYMGGDLFHDFVYYIQMDYQLIKIIQ